MTSSHYPYEWIAKAAEALGGLLDRPWTLLFVLLAVNSIAQPYGGITHDTRLYSGQVLNRVENGAYADDLFFRYGSQDEYSIFSRLTAPAVGLLGLPLGFFLIYVLTKSLLLFSMIRIVQTLIPHRAAATLALIYAMAIGIRYGGLHLLNVQENFLTPRTPACALVLLGLDFMLRGRVLVSGSFIVLALTIHPLMAFGSLLIWGAFVVWQSLGGKVFFGATAGITILAGAVLLIQPIGQRCFGEMDDAWRRTIMCASGFNFPSEWGGNDWIYLTMQLAIVGTAWWRIRKVDPKKARFLVILAIVAFSGVVGSVLAEQLPFALLLQGQPYRVLWILAILHLALAWWLCIEWSLSESIWVQLAGCGVLAYLCCVNGIHHELVLPALLFPLMALLLRGLGKVPNRASWLVESILGSLLLGAFGWMVYKMFVLVRMYDDLLLLHPEVRDIVEVMLRNLGPIVLGSAACWLIVLAQRRPRIGIAAVSACLTLQVLFFALPETDFYQQHGSRYRSDVRRVHDVIHANRSATQGLPTVYCNLGCLDYVWIDLHAKSYFDWWQAGNFMFRREMAMEGQRRAQLVGAFEIAHYRATEHLMSEHYKETVGRFFQTDFQSSRLTEQELTRLCSEPGLDFVILDRQIDGMEAVQVGRLFVYSCRNVSGLAAGNDASLRR